MGSLMAGWDSRVDDPRSVKYRRNRSLTKEEIDTYWKKKKEAEEEHLKAIHDLLNSTQESKPEESKVKMQRSSTLPAANTKGSFMDKETEASLEELIKQHGWWASANSAFLNEPPVLATEGPAYKYASQFHVANMAASKPHAAAGTAT